MKFGAHIRTGPGLGTVIDRAEAMGAEAVQVFPQNSRAWKSRRLDPVLFGEYRAKQAASAVVQATYVHAIYLINLGSPDPDVRARSQECLLANMRVAEGIGAEAVVLHLGSHKGTGLEACVSDLLLGLRDVLAETEGGSGLLLENAAGAGGAIGRTFDELALVIEALDGDERVGVCLDTQHLWAAGYGYDTPEEMEKLVAAFDSLIGLDRLRCLHLNDSKVPFGAGSDRHENLGEGHIGVDRLAVFLGHPALQELPALLEVSGIEGHGPGPPDLEVARRIHAEGLELYR